MTAASGRRLMSAPGIGAIIALTLHPSGRARPWAGHPALLCIMEPLLAARAALREQLILIVFSRETVAKADQVTPRKYHSGEMDRAGAISRAGDALVRVALFEAAHVIMTRSPKCSKIKAWAMNVAKRRGAKRAKVALARKLGVVLHRMWVDNTDFRFGQPAQA